MYELMYEISVLVNDGIIKLDIKTNSSDIKDITDITIIGNNVKVYNKKYGISVVYIDNIKEIKVVKI